MESKLTDTKQVTKNKSILIPKYNEGLKSAGGSHLDCYLSLRRGTFPGEGGCFGACMFCGLLFILFEFVIINCEETDILEFYLDKAI